MDHESLRTAATYLNNLLLARGLLRNGEPVDFVKPSKESRAQIINLVHDLILREDRDREQREHVAVTLRNLRADDARKTAEIDKLKGKCEVSARDVVQARTAERAAKEESKKVEKAMKALQDQATKLKTSLAQVKSQCANDVRKRDLELARLKAHLQGQQRGNRTPASAPSMTITGGARPKSRLAASGKELEDPAYSLQQETTEFLTQLSQSLSDENDGLISLVRGALGTMKELLGLEAGTQVDSAVGSMGSEADKGIVSALPTSYESLAADIAATLAHLKGILSNPNFVTVEEVEVREEEIARLREGWDRMEHRWKDVLVMMEGWRRRMDTGDTINIEDLRKGMGLVSPVRKENVQLPGEPEQSFVDDNSLSEIRLPGIEEETEDPSVILERSRRSIQSAGNSPKRKRDVLDPPEFFDLRPASSKAAPPSPHCHAEFDFSDNDSDGPPADDEPSEPVMTVEEKLHAAQAEAEEAAAAARERADPDPRPSAARSSSKGRRRRETGVLLGIDTAGDEEQDDTLGKLVASPMAKKTKIRGRPKRRKSTLNPEELEALLMSGDA